MSDAGKMTTASDDWLALTARLRDDTKRQISGLEEIQTNLQQWYSARPGRPAKSLELDECPALLRTFQSIRALRETVADLEQELTHQGAES